MICPECGCADVTLIKDIHYPNGSVTQLLDCPVCQKIVLQAALSEKST